MAQGETSFIHNEVTTMTFFINSKIFHNNLVISRCRETKIRHELYSQMLLVSFESQEIVKFGSCFSFRDSD